jgi:hypothetical protein
MGATYSHARFLRTPIKAAGGEMEMHSIAWKK